LINFCQNNASIPNDKESISMTTLMEFAFTEMRLARL